MFKNVRYFGCQLAYFLLSLTLLSQSLKAEQTSLPSFKMIPQNQQQTYQHQQTHGFCVQVFDMERTVLIMAQPALKGADEDQLKSLALGFQRCQAHRILAEVLAIAKLKGGEKLYAPYAPTPRIGTFDDLKSKDQQALLKARQDRGHLTSKQLHVSRPEDWLNDPMSLADEVRMNQAYTQFVRLGICHHMPDAFKDLGRFFDDGFSVKDPYVLYGLFAFARSLKIDAPSMTRRLDRIDDAFQPFERVHLSRLASDQAFSQVSQFSALQQLCQ